MKKSVDSILRNIYYDPAHPASYSGAEKLWKAAPPTLSRKDVRIWLQKQDAYTLHKPLKRKFQRNRYIVDNMDDLWQADLNDMKHIRKQNDGFNYILTVIDVFSRFSWAVPLRSKTGANVTEGFYRILKSTKRKPLKLMTDKGSEFLNKTFQDFLKKNSIGYYHSNNPDTKSSIVERLNRTLKSRMWRYFTMYNTKRYVEVLQKIVDAYNKSIHSTIKMAPADVTENNILQVWNNVHGAVKKKSVRARLKVGDRVRISREKVSFRKGYESNWSEEIFIVERVIKRRPPVYELRDLEGEIIEGTFYEPELQKIILSKSRTFKIDKVLQTRGRGIRKEALVKWRGYPTKFNSWIPASSIKKL